MDPTKRHTLPGGPSTWREQRDHEADEREAAADQRERTADQREQIADQREQIADQREQIADQREAELGIQARRAGQDARDRSDRDWEASARSEALIDRVMAAAGRRQDAKLRAEASRQRQQTRADTQHGHENQLVRDTRRTQQRQAEAVKQAREACRRAKDLSVAAREMIERTASILQDTRALRRREGHS